MTRELQFANAKRQERYLIFRLMINDYKVSRGCVECGYNKHPAALDFNHKDPKQKVQRIAAMYTYTLEKIMAELEKCEILCANCHRLRTMKRAGHGRQYEQETSET